MFCTRLPRISPSILCLPHPASPRFWKQSKAAHSVGKTRLRDAEVTGTVTKPECFPTGWCNPTRLGDSSAERQSPSSGQSGEHSSLRCPVRPSVDAGRAEAPGPPGAQIQTWLGFAVARSNPVAVTVHCPRGSCTSSPTALSSALTWAS